MVNQALPLRALRFVRDRIAYRLVVATPLAPRARSVLAVSSCEDLVVTVSFNQPEVIALQLEALGLTLEGGARVCVIDNSSNALARARIAAIAAQFGAIYIKAPWNPFSLFQGSLSHGSTLDWIAKHVIPVVSPRRLLLLDHDIIPTGPFSVGGFVGEQTAVGVEEVRAGMWYLWPGLLGLALDKVDLSTLSFMPYKELDTGGSLWPRLYKNLPEHDIRKVTNQEFQVAPGALRQETSVDLMDGLWVHLVDGSGWLDGEGKLQRLLRQSGEDANLTSLAGLLRLLRQKGVLPPDPGA